MHEVNVFRLLWDARDYNDTIGEKLCMELSLLSEVFLLFFKS
jgi:hypothetical protein